MSPLQELAPLPSRNASKREKERSGESHPDLDRAPAGAAVGGLDDRDRLGPVESGERVVAGGDRRFGREAARPGRRAAPAQLASAGELAEERGGMRIGDAGE